MTIPQDKLDELKTQAAAIAEAGAKGDTVIQHLSKGVSDALGTLASIVALAKGKKPAADDDNDGDDNDGDDDDDGDGDGKPGYTDMRMAVQQPRGQGQLPAPSAAQGQQGPDDWLDVSAYLFETGDQIRGLRKAVSKLTKIAVDQAAELAILRQMVSESAQANAQATLPLIKAVTELRSGLLDIPVAPITPGAVPVPRIGKPTAADAQFIGGSEEAEKMALLKALRLGFIDTGHKNLFRRTRRFAVAEADHAQIRKLVEEASQAA